MLRLSNLQALLLRSLLEEKFNYISFQINDTYPLPCQSFLTFALLLQYLPIDYDSVLENTLFTITQHAGVLPKDFNDIIEQLTSNDVIQILMN